MRRLLVVMALAGIAVAIPGTAFAGGNPSGTGQPSQTCGSTGGTNSEPGNASSAPGSAFNENGGKAGSVYAGSKGTPSAAHGSGNAVSQYDVACYQVSHH